jgi:hypothetical protein
MGCNLFVCPECGGKGFENKDGGKLLRAADAQGEREGKTVPGA